jgi:hypothetical protein
MKKHLCKVYWTSPEDGGRDVPFAGTWYSTEARFPQQSESNLQENGWSVVLEFTTPPTEQGNPSSGTARFLVEDAPEDWLYPGQVFGMHEGRRMTARVEIL